MIVWSGNGLTLNWLEGIPEQASGVINHASVGKHACDIRDGI